ncbi:Ger(x)C family spore germination protein [Paenibacillus sp. GYB003]|uniref:Ger(x)C family spore germination protein n=1 Tax=Paenibacillus sp. GYB003 TaxID=2994392 RepID=UPI002F967A5D
MKRLKLLLPLLLAFALSGCWDKLELEEQAYTVVLGVDKGEGDLIQATFQISNPQVGSSDTGSAENEPPSDTITISAPDILSAKELANSVITRKISFSHLRTMIVSEEFAKSKFFLRIISSSMRDPEMRREVNLIVSKEKASEFIDRNKPNLETRPHKYFAFMQERWRDTGNVPYSTLNRYFTRLTEDSVFLAIYATTERTPAAPRKNEDSYKAGQIPQKNGDPVQLMGSAIFKEGKMIGTLTGEETRYVLLLRRKSLAHSFISTFPDPYDERYQVTLRMIKVGNTDISVRVRNHGTTIHVKVPLKLQLLSIPSFTDYALDTKKQEVLKKTIQSILARDSKRLVEKMQQDVKGDPFLWNLSARTQFISRETFETFNWANRFPQADVRIDFDLTLESFGKQLNPPVPQKGDESD